MKIRDYWPIFQIDGGVVRLRAGVFPDVLVDCADDIDGGLTRIKA